MPQSRASRPYMAQNHLSTLQQQIARVRNWLESYLDGKPQTEIATDIDETSALGQLRRTFRLSAFECHILLLCVGMEIDCAFAGLCTKANGDESSYPTLSLAQSFLPGGNWSVLSAYSPLQHWQMLEFAPGFTLTQAAIRIDPRILCYLLGEPSIDEQLKGLVRLAPPEPEPLPLPPSQQAIADRCRETWSQAPGRLPPLLLCGSEYTDKTQIVTHLCDILGFNLGIINAAFLPSLPHEIQQLKLRWEREAILGNRILLLECDELTADPQKTAVISHFIAHLQTPLILSAQERLPHRHHSLVSFDVPPLRFHERKTLWESHLGAAARQLNGEVTKLSSQFQLSPAIIQAACAQVESAESPIASQLWDFCRTQARPRLDDLAQRIDATASWEDLVLPEPQKLILAEMATQLQNKFIVYQEWGFAGKSSRGLGLTTLFHGDSGTGKTMAAEVLAQHFRLDLYRIDLSATVSKYIGETEKNLARIFDAAETGGAILLFDEADALFGKRTEVKDSRDRHANVEVSYLLQRMEAYNGLAILTTNLKNALDTAFLRRIRFMVDFPFPSAQYRAQIWQRIFPPETPTQGLDYQKLGQLQVAGGNIRNIALNAAFFATDAGEPVMMKHILQSAQRDYLKLQKILTKEEIKGWVINQ